MILEISQNMNSNMIGTHLIMKSEENIMPLTDKNGQPLWKKQYEQQKRYDAENTIRRNIKLNKTTDADILEALEKAPNKQGFIKEAIRFYLAHGGGK